MEGLRTADWSGRREDPGRSVHRWHEEGLAAGNGCMTTPDAAEGAWRLISHRSSGIWGTWLASKLSQGRGEEAVVVTLLGSLLTGSDSGILSPQGLCHVWVRWTRWTQGEMVVWPVDARLVGALKWEEELKGCEWSIHFFLNPHNIPKKMFLSISCFKTRKRWLREYTSYPRSHS